MGLRQHLPTKHVQQLDRLPGASHAQLHRVQLRHPAVPMELLSLLERTNGTGVFAVSHLSSMTPSSSDATSHRPTFSATNTSTHSGMSSSTWQTKGQESPLPSSTTIPKDGGVSSSSTSSRDGLRPEGSTMKKSAEEGVEEMRMASLPRPAATAMKLEDRDTENTRHERKNKEEDRGRGNFPPPTGKLPASSSSSSSVLVVPIFGSGPFAYALRTAEEICNTAVSGLPLTRFRRLHAHYYFHHPALPPTGMGGPGEGKGWSKTATSLLPPCPSHDLGTWEVNVQTRSSSFSAPWPVAGLSTSPLDSTTGSSSSSLSRRTTWGPTPDDGRRGGVPNGTLSSSVSVGQGKTSARRTFALPSLRWKLPHETVVDVAPVSFTTSSLRPRIVSSSSSSSSAASVAGTTLQESTRKDISRRMDEKAASGMTNATTESKGATRTSGVGHDTIPTAAFTVSQDSTKMDLLTTLPLSTTSSFVTSPLKASSSSLSTPRTHSDFTSPCLDSNSHGMSMSSTASLSVPNRVAGASEESTRSGFPLFPSASTSEEEEEDSSTIQSLFSEFRFQWVDASCGGWEVVDAALGKKMRSHRSLPSSSSSSPPSSVSLSSTHTSSTSSSSGTAAAASSSSSSSSVASHKLDHMPDRVLPKKSGDTLTSPLSRTTPSMGGPLSSTGEELLKNSHTTPSMKPKLSKKGNPSKGPISTKSTTPATSPSTASSSQGLAQKVKDLLFIAIHGADAAAAAGRGGGTTTLASSSTTSTTTTPGLLKRPLLQPRRPSSLVLVDTRVDPTVSLRHWLMFAESLSEAAAKSSRRPRRRSGSSASTRAALSISPVVKKSMTAPGTMSTNDGGRIKNEGAPGVGEAEENTSQQEGRELLNTTTTTVLPLPKSSTSSSRKFHYDVAKSRLFLDFHPNPKYGGVVGQVVRLTWMEGARRVPRTRPPTSLPSISEDDVLRGSSLSSSSPHTNVTGPTAATAVGGGGEKKGTEANECETCEKHVQAFGERRIIAEFRVVAPDLGTFLKNMMLEEYGFLEEVVSEVSVDASGLGEEKGKVSSPLGRATPLANSEEKKEGLKGTLHRETLASTPGGMESSGLGKEKRSRSPLLFLSWKHIAFALSHGSLSSMGRASSSNAWWTTSLAHELSTNAAARPSRVADSKPVEGAGGAMKHTIEKNSLAKKKKIIPRSARETIDREWEGMTTVPCTTTTSTTERNGNTREAQRQKEDDSCSFSVGEKKIADDYSMKKVENEKTVNTTGGEKRQTSDPSLPSISSPTLAGAMPLPLPSTTTTATSFMTTKIPLKATSPKEYGETATFSGTSSRMDPTKAMATGTPLEPNEEDEIEDDEDEDEEDDEDEEEEEDEEEAVFISSSSPSTAGIASLFTSPLPRTPEVHVGIEKI